MILPLLLLFKKLPALVVAKISKTLGKQRWSCGIWSVALCGIFWMNKKQIFREPPFAGQNHFFRVKTKKMISASKQRVEHLFAGWNTQQLQQLSCNLIAVVLMYKHA